MVDIDRIVVNGFKETIARFEKFVIVPHVNPDGDAIGASLAVRKVLLNMGKSVRVIIPNDFPDFLQWMEGSEQVIDYTKKSRQARLIFNEAEVLICLDFNEFERSEGLKKLLKAYAGPSILIDHHPNPTAQCSIMLSYPEVSSTCELVFRVLELAGLGNYIDKSAAEAIFAGMMTDTGNFSYNASDPETYRIIAKLLERGIDKDVIHSNIYHTFSLDRWRLIGHALKEKMVILPEFRTGYICLSNEELERFNFQSGDTEGLVNYPLMVKDIVFCVLMQEKKDRIKMSFRSKGSFPANEISSIYFKGGGHLNAAGGESFDTLENTVAKLMMLFEKYKQQLIDSF